MGLDEYLATHDIDRSDVGPFLFIHTVLSAVLVGSTWCMCYFAGKNPPPQSFLTSIGDKHVPNSLLLNSITKMPLLSDALKRKACEVIVSRRSYYFSFAMTQIIV
jgi:hypothetical protein